MRGDKEGSYQTYTGGVLRVQLWIGGHVVIIFHIGNPPLIQYSRSQSTYPNHGKIFSPNAPTRTGKGVRSCIVLQW